MTLSREKAALLLKEMAEWLEFKDCAPVQWVVCGGIAMSFQNLTTRTTRDVDVVGDWNQTLAQIVAIDIFPEKVTSCIRRVVENHPELAGFGENWINLGPRKLALFGLPDGFAARMTAVQFGPRLTLHLLGRPDLIALKLYAVADDFGARQEIHFRDLQALTPTFEELDTAIDWIRSLPDFETKRPALKNAIEELGYDDLSYYV